jgi:hypothetical protein
MSKNLSRLQKIEEALEQLLAKKKAYIVWGYLAETREEAIQAAIDAGIYDPDIHEPVFIKHKIPMKTDYNQGRNWKPDLPETRKPSQADMILEEINALAKFDSPAGPVPEPKPEQRRRIHYPDMGIV